MGIALLGGAVGLPILLGATVIGLGIVGLITLVSSLRQNPGATPYFADLIHRIANDEALRRTRKEMREAMVTQPTEPRKQGLKGSDAELAQRLLTMPPFDFERHVMAFFQDKGLIAWVTRKSNDFGVDGFAKHPNGLIVVQCKRNTLDNSVGRPIVQQFKGVVEENAAWRGYIVTTSYFTTNAIDSAQRNERLQLVDLEELICWHKRGIEI